MFGFHTKKGSKNGKLHMRLNADEAVIRHEKAEINMEEVVCDGYRAEVSSEDRDDKWA